MEAVDELTPEEHAAALALTRALVALPRAIDAELLSSADISLHEYTVLSALATAPRHRCAHSDLAEALPMSSSGLSRLLSRLHQQGLVEREQSRGDRRVQLAVLTAAGLQLFEAARPAYFAIVRCLVRDILGRLDLREATRIFDEMASWTPH